MCRESNAQHRIVACFQSPSKRHSREKPLHGCIFRSDLEGRSSAGSSYAVFKCWLVSKDEASTHPGHQFEAWGRLTTPGSKDGKEDLATRRSCVLQQGMKDMGRDSQNSHMPGFPKIPRMAQRCPKRMQARRLKFHVRGFGVQRLN